MTHSDLWELRYFSGLDFFTRFSIKEEVAQGQSSGVILQGIPQSLRRQSKSPLLPTLGLSQELGT